jgi:hypothetical protein
MSARATPWTTAALATACAGLGVAVALELSGGLSLAPEVTAAAPAAAELEWSPEVLEFEPPAADGLEDTTARPLFSPSRRPFVVTEEAEPEPAAGRVLPALQLIGVLITADQRAALVQAEDAPAPSWVREGAAIGGWRIEAIEASRVRLRGDDQLEIVELRPDTAVPAASRPKRERPQTDEERREAARAAGQPDDGGEAEAEPDPEAVDEDYDPDAAPQEDPNG